MESLFNSQSVNYGSGAEKIYSQREVDDLIDKSKTESKPEKLVTEVTDAASKKTLENDTAVAKLVKKSNRILCSAKAVFPFDFFPDVINVEEGRVAVVHRHLLSSLVHSVDIRDISNVFINKSIFFSQIEVVSRTFEDNEVKIRFLKNKEAIFIRRMIEGLRIFENKQIDTSSFSKEELIAKLEELSTTAIVT